MEKYINLTIMKKSILILCISIFSLALFGQTPQKADVAPKVDINKTKVNDSEVGEMREERIKKELKAEEEAKGNQITT